MFSLQQLVFFLSFFSLFFIIIIFGEIPGGIVLMAVVTILFLVFHRKIQWQKISAHPKIIIPFLLILLFSFLSLFTTQSIPLTANRFMFFTFSFVCFIFFLGVEEKWLSAEVLSYGFVLTSIVLCFLSLLLFFVPDLARYLPSFNLLIANYGHNHASIYFLFTLPLSFQIWIKNKQKKIFLIPLLVSLLGLFVSFARIATVLAFLELVFSFWQFRKQLHSKISFTLFLPFLIFGVIFLFFTFFPQFSANQHCILPIFKTQLCKPLNEEARPQYWLQALKGTAAKPFTGWGGGTFVIISQRLEDTPSPFLSYSHNEYLQIFPDYVIIT